MSIINKGAIPGDLKSFRVEINGTDVTNAVVSAHIFQDIFSSTNSCSVNFSDSGNLIMSLPIRAGSKLKIHYSTEMQSEIGDGVMDWEFTIHKVSDVDRLSHKHLAYSIYAADRCFALDKTKKVLKSYSDMPVTSIAAGIVQEYLGKTTKVHPSDNNLHVCIPNWNPITAVSWTQRHAMKEGRADYVFYQMPDSNFEYKSFEILYSSPSESCGMTFIIRPSNLKDEKGDSLYDHYQIPTHYHYEHFDAMLNMQTGFYASKLATFNLITKEYKVEQYTLGDDFSEDKSMTQVDDDLFANPHDAHIAFMFHHPKMFDKPSHLDTSKEWFPSRKASMMKFDQEKLLMQLPGCARSARWFARNCIVDLPVQDWKEGENDLDDRRKGKYLITAIAHMLNKDTYTINMELVKKRLEEA